MMIFNGHKKVIEELKDELGVKNLEIEKLKEKLEEKNLELERLRQELEKKEQKEHTLKEELKKLESLLNNLRNNTDQSLQIIDHLSCEGIALLEPDSYNIYYVNNLLKEKLSAHTGMPVHSLLQETPEKISQFLASVPLGTVKPFKELKINENIYETRIGALPYSNNQLLAYSVYLKDITQDRKIEELFIKTVPNIAKSIYKSSIVGGSAYKLKTKLVFFRRDIDEILSAIKSINESIQQMTQSTVELEQTQKNITQKVENGAQVIEDSVQSIEKSSAVMEQLAQSTEELKKRISGIDHVLDVILEITEQTNLLALNAAIEAARAGEVGRGFAVVADEVRKLAEKTSKSANEIREVVNAIVEEMEKTIKEVEKAKQTVSESVRYTTNVSEIFREIKAKVNKISQMIKKQTEFMKSQASYVQSVVKNADGLSKGFNEVDAISDEITEISIKTMERLKKSWDMIAEFKTELGVEILKRIVDHAIWMRNVIKSIKGEIQWTPTDHTQCNLGKWYYSEGRKQIEQYGEEAVKIFEEMEEYHAGLHKIGIEAIKKHQEGKYEESYQLVAEMLSYSQHIIDLLDRLTMIILKKDHTLLQPTA
ncbi:MAG: hypothetical protein GXO22_08660 [Aquificae bacterium]|nr:hypothetical protein [Aquificota bacterium]